jgi:FAD/FMN-containing dehydrogenase
VGDRPGTKTSDTLLNDSDIQTFKQTFRGIVVTPEDPGYDEARSVYNRMIDRRPRLIARCRNVADVMSAVNFAREHHLPPAIRGGGHNVAGFGVCDDGIVIDMSLMKGIRVDPEQRTVRAEAGCTWGDLDHATHPFGLAAPGGIISTTGIAGLTLGGGVGHLTRKCGLSCDNLLSVDLVSADGGFLTASETKNEDLFWAIRGGGGNFGVITSFEYTLHPVKNVVAGPILYSLDRSREAMRAYRDFMKTAPDEVNGFFVFLKVPPGPPFPEALWNQTMCGAVMCYLGAPEKANQALKPLIDFGPPALVGLTEMPYPALQGAFDALVPKGLLHYWKADFVNELTDDMIDVHAQFGPMIPTINSALHIYPVSGAAQRRGRHDTAWSYRDAEYVHVIAAMYDNDADTEGNRAWVREYWKALHPLSAGGSYVNFLMDAANEDEGRVAASYRDNYDRLAAVKARYDPNNLFSINQNIKPATAGTTPAGQGARSANSAGE